MIVEKRWLIHDKFAVWFSNSNATFSQTECDVKRSNNIAQDTISSTVTC